MPIEAVQCQVCEQLHKKEGGNYFSIDGEITRALDGPVATFPEGEDSIIICRSEGCVLQLFELKEESGLSILESGSGLFEDFSPPPDPSHLQRIPRKD